MDHVEELKNLYGKIHQLNEEVMELLLTQTPDLKSGSMTPADMCDYGFLCREMEHLFDELRKEVKARKELCGRVLALRKTKEVLQNPESSLVVRGKLASGTPDLKMQAALPKKGSKEYYKLTDFLGVPRPVAEKGVLKLDWKKVIEICTQAKNDGKPLPPGLGQEYPLYTVRHRKV